MYNVDNDQNLKLLEGVVVMRIYSVGSKLIVRNEKINKLFYLIFIKVFIYLTHILVNSGIKHINHKPVLTFSHPHSSSSWPHCSPISLAPKLQFLISQSRLDYSEIRC